jgi:hypothetical protein
VVMAANVVIHILNEAASPSSAMTRTMWCGATCVELFYGPFVPDMDFCMEPQAEFATCAACQMTFESRVVSL